RSKHGLSYLLYNLPFLALAGWRAWPALRRLRPQGGAGGGALSDRWMGLWVLAAFVGGAGGRRVYGHYFIHLFSAFALLAARGWLELKGRMGGFRWKAVAAGVFAMVLFSAYRFQERNLVFLYDELTGRPISDRWVLVRFNRDIANIARYVDEHAAPGE